MDVPISEISYGFAFIENAIRSYRGARFTPYFPTLREEAIRGYDVRIRLAGATRFFQFKIPKVMVRATAEECFAPSNLSTPFLRMPLMRRPYSDQHNILVLLRRHRRRVFYVCPRMFTTHDFNLSYRNASVHLDSAYVDPSRIGRIADREQHHVSFEPHATLGWFRSDPKNVRIFGVERAFPNSERPMIGKPMLERADSDLTVIRQTLREFGISDGATGPAQSRAFKSPIAELAFICRHYLGLHPMMPVLQHKTT